MTDKEFVIKWLVRKYPNSVDYNFYRRRFFSDGMTHRGFLDLIDDQITWYQYLMEFLLGKGTVPDLRKILEEHYKPLTEIWYEEHNRKKISSRV